MKGKPKSKAKQQKKQEEERKGTEKERKLTISHSIRRERGRKNECKEMNWKEENHIKEINNGKRSKTSSTEI